MVALSCTASLPAASRRISFAAVPNCGRAFRREFRYGKPVTANESKRSIFNCWLLAAHVQLKRHDSTYHFVC